MTQRLRRKEGVRTRVRNQSKKQEMWAEAVKEETWLMVELLSWSGHFGLQHENGLLYGWP